MEIEDLNKHNENVWDNLGFVDGNGTTTEITRYSFKDKIENLANTITD